MAPFASSRHQILVSYNYYRRFPENALKQALQRPLLNPAAAIDKSRWEKSSAATEVTVEDHQGISGNYFPGPVATRQSLAENHFDG
jgi:hypothetical protein